jgi:hypothetical protein
MKNKISMALLATGLLIPLSMNVFAQGAKPQNGRPSHEQFNRRDGDRDQRGSSRRSPAKMQLTRTWHGIGDLEKSKTPLSKAQAKQVVALVLPWSKKQTMNSTDAEKLDDRLKAVLTSAQKSSIGGDFFRGPRGDGPRSGGPRGGGQRDGGRPRGDGPRGEGPRIGERDGRNGQNSGPRAGGNRESGGRFGAQDDKSRQLMRNWMESYNPFYAPTGNANWKKLPTEFQQNISKRYRESRATLEALSRKSK